MKNNRTIIYISGFLFALPIALASYINSSFISSFTGEKYIGILYALGSLCSIIALLVAPKIFQRIGAYKFLLFVILLNSLTFLTLSIGSSAWLIAIIFILGLSLNTLVVFSLDEILKILSPEAATGKTRGLYLAISNLAWILAQLASGTILGGFSFRAIYLTSFFVMILLFVVSLVKLKKLPDPSYDNIKNLKYVKVFFRNTNLFRVYVISLLLHLFFAWMVIYTPIYLYNYIGFSWKELGIIFAIMLLPFSIIPFHLGRYADKIGERSLLMLGFSIISMATITIFFINTNYLWIWALVLFTTRIGAATIEVMSDAYFFKHIKPENEEFIGVYRSASPVAYIIGPILASLLFFVIPSFNFIYLVLGACMIFGIYLASTIERADI